MLKSLCIFDEMSSKFQLINIKDLDISREIAIDASNFPRKSPDQLVSNKSNFTRKISAKFLVTRNPNNLHVTVKIITLQKKFVSLSRSYVQSAPAKSYFTVNYEEKISLPIRTYRILNNPMHTYKSSIAI